MFWRIVTREQRQLPLRGSHYNPRGKVQTSPETARLESAATLVYPTPAMRCVSWGNSLALEGGASNQCHLGVE